MDTLLRESRHALRALRRSPGFAALVVLTLALGIGANTAIFSIVEHVLLNSLPYAHADRLVTLAAGDATTLHPKTVSYGLVADWRPRVHSLSSIAMYRSWSPTLDAGGRPAVLLGERISFEYLPTLGVAPAIGRGFAREEDRPDRWHVVLLSDSLWRTRFGGRRDVIGRSVLLNGIPFEIVGVMPRTFRAVTPDAGPQPPQIWAPLGYDRSLPEACRSCQHLRAVARLAPGVTLPQARAELRTVMSSLARAYPNEYSGDATAVVTPLLDTVVQGVRQALWIVFGATVFVLLVASVNAAALLLVAVERRRQQLAVRAALGADRRQLIAHVSAESVLLTLFGGAAAVGLAAGVVKAVTVFAPADLPRLDEVHIDLSVLAFTLLVCLATALIAAFVPAWQAARIDQREALQEGARGTAGPRRRSRQVLLIVEIALAFVLAVGAGLLGRSLAGVLRSNPGFEIGHLYTANLALVGPQWADDGKVEQFNRRLLGGIRAIPGVDHAALVSTLPLGGSFDQRGFHIQDRPQVRPADAPSVDSYYVTPDYFDTMRIPLTRRRFFSESDVDAAARVPVAIVSETTARQMWPGEDALGKRIQLGGRHEDRPWATIVGIVPDVRQYALDAAPTPDAYLLEAQMPLSFPVLVVRSEMDPDALTRSVEAVVSRLDKSVPVYEVATMKALVAASVAQRRFVATLVSAFGVLAFVLAGIGIFGVTAYGIAQRTPEIGVRMALGATPSSIARLVAREGAALAVAGVSFGLALALSSTGIIRSQLYGVTATDPIVLAGAAVAIGAMVLVACWVPARRAMRVDPMVALRRD